MSLSWFKCFLCNGCGRLLIGKNYNKFFTQKSIQCPICKGKGQLAVKNFPLNPWNKDRRNLK